MRGRQGQGKKERGLKKLRKEGTLRKKDLMIGVSAGVPTLLEEANLTVYTPNLYKVHHP
jgi:hypothetical protein